MLIRDVLQRWKKELLIEFRGVYKYAFIIEAIEMKLLYITNNSWENDSWIVIVSKKRYSKKKSTSTILPRNDKTRGLCYRKSLFANKKLLWNTYILFFQTIFEIHEVLRETFFSFFLTNTLLILFYLFVFLCVYSLE
jgi:hypothetical protein